MDLVKEISLSLEMIKKDPKKFFKRRDKDKTGRLSIDHFRDILTNELKITIENADFDKLWEKYASDKNEIKYKAIVKDIEKLRNHKAEDSSGLPTPVISKMVDKISKFIKKRNLEAKTIDEMFYLDRYYEGLLDSTDIKMAFHNAEVKLSTQQVTDLLADFTMKNETQYDYVQILVSLFGSHDDIKYHYGRNIEKSKEKTESLSKQESFSSSTPKLKTLKEENKYESSSNASNPNSHLDPIPSETSSIKRVTFSTENEIKTFDDLPLTSQYILTPSSSSPKRKF